MGNKNDPLPYLENVENGFVSPAVSQQADNVEYEHIVESHYSPEELLKEVEQELGTDLANDINTDQIPVDRVEIDSKLGIVSILENHGHSYNLEERYTLLGILAAESGPELYFGSDWGALVQKSEEIEQGGFIGPHLAAAYTTFDTLIDLSSKTLREENQLVTPESQEDDIRMTPSEYTTADARSNIRILDNAFNRLKDQHINSLLGFETAGEASISKNEHPFNKRSKGSRGVQAGRKFSDFFNSLYNAEIIDYNLKVEGHEEDNAVISIRQDVTSGSIKAIGDFFDRDQGTLKQEEVEMVVDQRFRNRG